ncbi:MAG: HRDC domain-containing protein [Acidimicrobiales bacterium]
MGPAPPSEPTPRWVDTTSALHETVDALLAEPAYALDTEFHRERTYFPKLALLQIAWPGHLVLIDPLAVDVAPLAEVLTGDGLAVLHAADQDLEVLEQVCGVVPARLFDTQVAAGFLGMATPSLASLYERELGLHVPKADRLTDWLARPLTDAQCAYAASDVAHLLDVHRSLVERLTARGRLQWALDECEGVRLRSRGARDPADAWRRIKEARQLRGKARSVARSVAAWRERRAAALDQPPRFVLPDLAVVGIAQRPPKSLAELRRVRGLDERHLRDDLARQVLDAVADGLAARPPASDDAPPRELDRELRPAVGLVSAWVSQLARDRQIDTALLATRADLEALLRGDEDARLAVGWRAELVGEPIRKLVSGEAALAFDGHGGLVLEARSHRSLHG